MKLSSSTGDFRHYADRISEEVACFKETKLRYINLEQDGNVPEPLFEDDGARRALPTIAARRRTPTLPL